MKKILCPTDFSDTAMNAVAYAAKMAKKLGAELTLFHVHSLAELTPEEALVGAFQNTTLAEARLEQQCDELRKVFRISCDGEVATSVVSVNDLISEKAKGFDMIIMGSNGPDGIAQFFLGSNTYQVIKKSATPVLLIPDACGYCEIKTLVYAFDYWRNDRLPLTQLVMLTKALGCELRVLQVMEESYSRMAEEEVKQEQETYLDFYKSEVSISFDTIYAADLIDSLHTYVLRNNADLLALCTENHTFLQKMFHKSVVKALSGKVTYPLFVFHS